MARVISHPKHGVHAGLAKLQLPSGPVIDLYSEAGVDGTISADVPDEDAASIQYVSGFSVVYAVGTSDHCEGDRSDVEQTPKWPVNTTDLTDGHKAKRPAKRK